MGLRVKVLRTDNEREFISQEFKCFLQKEGIQHQLTVSCTPQQNRLAERYNRTIVRDVVCRSP